MLTMILDIFSDHIRCYFVPNRSGKVTIFPEVTTPKLVLNFGVPLEYYTGTYALQFTNNFRYIRKFYSI